MQRVSLAFSVNKMQWFVLKSVRIGKTVIFYYEEWIDIRVNVTPIVVLHNPYNVRMVLAPNDGIAIELLQALKLKGYGTGGGHPWPVVSGQDADVQSVRSIIRNEQAFTIFKDNRELALAAESVLAFYAIGNACLLFAMCPYLLLYARGQMGLHVAGQLLLLAALAPAMFWAARHGIDHTGPVWMACNALYLLLWVPVMHQRHWPGMCQSSPSTRYSPGLLACTVGW